MALADPQSLTIAGTAHALPRTSMSVNAGIFTSADGLVKETVSHQLGGKRTRHLIRVDHRKVAADPFIGSVNAEYGMSAYLVVDVPAVGYTIAQQKEVVDAFMAQLAASSGALVTRVLGGEI